MRSLEGQKGRPPRCRRHGCSETCASLEMVAAIGAHIPSDCRLSDLEAELEQFTVNVRGAPERVRSAHFANERAQLSRDLRSANMVARSPAPIRPKPSAVPANDRLRSDNRNRAQNGGKPAIEPN